MVKPENQRRLTAVGHASVFLNKFKLNESLALVGHESWKIWDIKNTDLGAALEIKTYLLQELFAKGIFMIGSHNVSYSFEPAHVDQIKRTYEEILGEMSLMKTRGEPVIEHLNCLPLTNLFKVR